MAKCLGPKETEVIARLSYEKVNIITKKQFDKLFGESVLTRQIIYQLKKKGILKPITRGIYYYSPLESGPAGSRINEFLIPPVLFPKNNYYVGYSTMYNYYGFSEQIFQTFYILNTSLQRKRIIFGTSFKLLKVPPERMYGLVKIKIKESEIIVSDKERTLIDLIFFPDPVGGIGEAMKILEGTVKTGGVNLKQLIRYAALFPNIATRKRIGFTLDKCKVPGAAVSPLVKTIKRTSLATLYGSKSRKGPILNKWRVIIDDTR